MNRGPGASGPRPKEMTEADVLRFLDLCGSIEVDVVVDGGWGVDALLGRQTRRHGDLDIALPIGDLPRVRSALEGLGYVEAPRNDSSEWQFVLADEAGHEIDVHGFAHDETGKQLAGVPYVYESLGGTGTIGGRAVRCITPEWMVRYHTGYEPDEDDRRDVHALCEAFGIELPEGYRGADS